MSGGETKTKEIHPEVPPDLPGDSMVSYNPTRTVAVNQRQERGAAPPSSSANAGRPEITCQGRYQLLSPIGKGGFGEVREAEQVELGRIVAVKRLRKDVLKSHRESSQRKLEELRESFRQEALTSGSLEHPNIVPVHDLGLDSENELLLAMKRIQGKPWDKMLFSEGVNTEITPAEFLAKHLPIFVQMCQAVAYAHSRGIIHRDLKPTQVIVGEYGEVLLMDWGLAVVYAPEKILEHNRFFPADVVPGLANATSPAGTPAFMAPEQTEKTAAGTGPWTDVYLLGGTLYYLLTLHPPHQADSSRESFMKARLGYVIPPEERTRRAIPSDLSELAMDALEPDPSKRVPSVQEFLRRVQNHLSGESRRRESEELTLAVKEELEKPHDTGYDVYADGLANLSRAEALWAGNPEIPALRMDYQVAYAKAALESGDLALARVQVRNMEESPTRNTMIRHVEEAEGAVKRKERQRRFMLATTLFLLAVLASISGFYNLRLAEERNSAGAARDQAQRMVSFMIDDLMKSMDNLSPLRQAAERVLSYYDQIPQDYQTTEIRVQRIEALSDLGRVYDSMGDSDQALAYLERAKSEGRALLQERSRSQRIMESLASVFVQEGIIRFQRGEQAALPQGLANASAIILHYIAENQSGSVGDMELAEVEDLAAQLDQFQEIGSANKRQELLDTAVDLIYVWKRDDTEWMLQLSGVYIINGGFHFERGEYESALRAYQKAMIMRVNIPTDEENQRRVLDSLMVTHLDVARTLRKLGEMEQATSQFDEAMALADEIDQAPMSYLAINFPVRWIEYGKHMLALGNENTAVRVIESCLQTLRLMAERDTRNIRYRAGLFEGTQALAEVYHTLGDYNAAQRHYSDALAMVDQLIEADPSTVWFGEARLQMLTQYLGFARAAVESGESKAANFACSDLLAAIPQETTTPLAEEIRSACTTR